LIIKFEYEKDDRFLCYVVYGYSSFSSFKTLNKVLNELILLEIQIKQVPLGGEVEEKKINWVRWKTVCLAKDGGLCLKIFCF